MSISFQGRYQKSSDNQLIEEIKELFQDLLGSAQFELYYGVNPPSNPKDGDFWFNPDENRLYAYVE